MVTVAPHAPEHNFFVSRYEEPDNGHLPMHKELDRLKSYQNWPCKFMEPTSLAKAGFYYVNKDDIVRCAFCNIEIGQWQRGDNAMIDHQKWSDDCPFVLGYNCGNVPIDIDDVPMSSSGQDTCGKYGIEIRPNSYPEKDAVPNTSTNLTLSKLGVQPSRGPAYPGFATYDARLNSFSEWPRSMKQKPDELAAAGFFYNGKGDQTICYHCGGGLKDWEDDDKPWEQHARWFQKCNFVRLQKGQEYISEVCNRQEAILTAEEAASLQDPPTNNLNITPVNHKLNSASSSSTSQSTEIKTKEVVASEDHRMSNTNTLCKICYCKEVGVVFLPCGHIVACVDCAPALTTCAVCRKPLEATVRAFLS